MPSLKYRVLLASVGLLTVPVYAQNSTPNSAPTRTSGAMQGSGQSKPSSKARVQHVVVRGSGDAMEVEIQTSGAAVAPDTQAITGPDRVVVDFPGAVPDAALRALTVNRGALKGVRSGLFSNNPPITRVVLDLTEPRSYQTSSSQNAFVIKLGPVKSNSANLNSAKLNPEKSNPAVATPAKADTAKSGPGAPANRRTSSGKPGLAKAVVTGPDVPVTHTAKLETAALVANNLAGNNNEPGTNAASVNIAAPSVSAAVSPTVNPTDPAARVPLPPMPLVAVTFANGMLSIHAENATLAQVLFEVQRQTQAEIAIPAGAEREQVIANLGPAPAREVLGSLLNGSPYNFIFVGHELSLERVILTLR